VAQWRSTAYLNIIGAQQDLTAAKVVYLPLPHAGGGGFLKLIIYERRKNERKSEISG
jgi:hypothetical protein